MTNLDKIFNSVGSRSLFKNKQILQSNYSPEDIPHRDKEIEHIASILAPSLLGQKTSNLFIYGKTGCISGDSLIYTNNGLKQIRFMDCNKDRVLSFNISSKKYEWSDFIFLKFENSDKLLKISLNNGFQIIVTKDHPLLLNNLTWKKADELNINDEVCLSYEMPNINYNDVPIRLARLLGFIIADGSLENFARSEKIPKFSVEPFENSPLIAKKANYSKFSLNKRERRTKDSRGNGYNSNRQRCRFFSEDNELLNLVQEDLRELYNCTPQIIFPKNRCTHVNVISQQVCSNLHFLGIPFGKKSNIVKIPNIILQAPNIIQREFLKALFSCDGSVSQNTYMIEYYSNSYELLKQIAYILYSEGITCKIKEKKVKLNGKIFDSFRLYISGQENLIKFYNKIGFYCISKNEKLKNLINKYEKNMGISNDNFKFSKIVNIEETYESFVYDLTVPKNHNFIANGIISHNTGKTLSVQHVANELLKRTKDSRILRIEYINCKLKKVADTEYRIFAELIKKLGGEVPATGLPTDQVYKKFIELIEGNQEKLLIVILDEIDQAVKKISDDFLYNLMRLNSELDKTQITILGISNDAKFLEMVDPRVKSSLSEEEMIFTPYNAPQLQDILKKRADEAFKESVVSEGVIAKCAAYAAREHGDARRALDLLRVAGEMAERSASPKIEIKHIDEANDKIERDKILDIIETAPRQFQLVLYSIIDLTQKSSDSVFTGDIYNYYSDLCKKVNFEVLTQRRVGDIIAEFDMLGLINARVISKGRQGRTREIRLDVPDNVLKKSREILEESLGV